MTCVRTKLSAVAAIYACAGCDRQIAYRRDLPTNGVLVMRNQRSSLWRSGVTNIGLLLAAPARIRGRIGIADGRLQK